MPIIGVMNSHIMSKIINTLSPTLNFEVVRLQIFQLLRVSQVYPLPGATFGLV